MFKRILLAYDGSEGAKLALGKAAEMATAFAAELHILAVGRIPEYAETVSEVEEALHGLKERGLAGQSRIDFGKPGDVILRIAEDLSVDLIIMGTKPHSPLRRRFLGATVDKVIDHAHCSVLVVRSDA